MIIKDYMTAELVTLDMNSTLSQARALMEEKRIRQIPVVDQDGILKGIVSKRDVYAASVSNLTDNFERSKQLLEGHVSVTEIMTTQVETVQQDDELSTAAIKLQEMRIGAMPVLEGNKLVGIISSSDFLSIAVMLLNK